MRSLMIEVEGTSELTRRVPHARPRLVGWTVIDAADPVRLSEQIGGWNFEFTQLTAGDFSAAGAALDLGSVSVARMSVSQTLLHRGCAPGNMAAVMLPGRGSGQVFAHGQLLQAGQCVTLAEGAFLEAITHGHYVNVALGVDVDSCREQLDHLSGGSLDLKLTTTIAAPGVAWIDDMGVRVERILTAAVGHPQLLSDQRIQACLTEHVLTAMVHFDNSPADVDSSTRAARAGRRVAVRLARDLIHSRLSEPLRLSELCRHARLKMRALEYGFREVTGLTPMAYIRSVRLNAVRRSLLHDASAQHRSISEIAMDAGFWHLGQFSRDYRLFFGETPTETRRLSRVRR